MIHDFNDTGFDALDPKWSGGAPRKIDETTRTRICAAAGCNPHALGQPFSVWFGPLNLMPRKGEALRPVQHPKRQSATYIRTHGVRHMLAALDLATGKITYLIRQRWPQFLDFLKVLRARARPTHPSGNPIT